MTSRTDVGSTLAGNSSRLTIKGAAMAAKTDLDEMLRDLAQGGGPLIEAVAQMNLGTLDQAGVDEKTALMARFGALVALDASPASYLVHLTLAEEAGIEPSIIEAVLATLAPLVGTARVVSAADRVLQAMQMANRV
jgi:4-carboxymuconolactone decarboxylase